MVVSICVSLLTLSALALLSVSAVPFDVYFAVTTATLLSGSGLGDCAGAKVNSSTCTGGAASVALVSRRHRNATGVDLFVLPYLDRQTAFVQMHPNTWAVNNPILEHLGFPAYTAPPSLFSGKEGDGWGMFHNSSLAAISSNAIVSRIDPWYLTAARSYIYNGTLLVMVCYEDSSPTVVSCAAAVHAILRDMRLRNAFLMSVLVLDNYLQYPDDVYTSLAADSKPDVIIYFGLTAQDPYFISSTIVVTIQLSPSVLHVVKMSQDNLTMTDALVTPVSLSIVVGTGDARYYSDQAYLQSFAVTAIANDPSSGTSGYMPPHRNGTIRICYGGLCPGGRLYAESMRFTQNTDVAFLATGAFRGNGWAAGQFNTSNVWSLNPFNDLVCYGVIRGLTLWEVLNYSLAMSTAPSTSQTVYGDRLLQFSGMRVRFDPALNGTRVLSIEIWSNTTGEYRPLDRLALYRYASDSYVAQTFTPFPALLSGRYEGEIAPTCLSGEMIQTAVPKYMAWAGYFNTSDQGLLIPTAVNLTSGEFAPMNLTQEIDLCGANTRWVPSVASCLPCDKGLVSTPKSAACVAPQVSEDWKIIAIAVPVGSTGLLLIIVWASVLYWQWRRNVRNVENAPKNGNVTILFTDIQDSTKLWGCCPASMSVSLDHHHRLIRECIAKHKGYEVKTVGDCFMIAIGDAVAGVRLACDIQAAMQSQHFPRAIRCVYQHSPDDNDVDSVPDLVDDPDDLDDIDPLCNGLRVRIGIHTGAPDIVFDVVSKGFDYYGPPVNVAARVETTARGGQINVSRDVMACITESQHDTNIDEDIECFLLGSFELKGVAGKTEVFTVMPRALKHRRSMYDSGVGAGGQLPDNPLSDSATIDSTSQISQSYVDNDIFRKFVSSICAALRVLKAKQQDEILRTLCRGWQVKNFKEGMSVEERVKLFALKATVGIRRGESNRSAWGMGTQALNNLTAPQSPTAQQLQFFQNDADSATHQPNALLDDVPLPLVPTKKHQHNVVSVPSSTSSPQAVCVPSSVANDRRQANTHSSLSEVPADDDEPREPEGAEPMAFKAHDDMSLGQRSPLNQTLPPPS